MDYKETYEKILTEHRQVYERLDQAGMREFIEEVKKQGAKVLALSTLMSTSMKNMGKIIELLKEQGAREGVSVIVGGAPISESFARKIGADGYSANATEAVKLVDRLVAEKSGQSRER